MRNAFTIGLVLVLFGILGCASGGGKQTGGAAESGKMTVKDERGFDRNLGPAEIAYQSAQQFLAASNYDEAISQLRTATSLKPTYTEAWTDLGSTLTKLKDYQGGINAYERALALKPESGVLMQAIAYNYLAIDNLDKAEEYYMKVVQKDTMNYEANRNLGFIYQKKNDTDQAIRYYQVALKVQPNDATTMGTLATLYEKKGDEAKKLEYLKMAVTAAPDNFNFKRLLGAAYMKDKDYADAAPIFEELTKNYPDQALYHQNLGLALSQLPDRRADAATELEKTLQLKGDDPYVSGILAKLYNDLQQYQKAIDAAKKGLSAPAGGQEALLHYQWGYALSKLGQYDDATTEFEKVVATKDVAWLDAAKKEIARQAALKKRAEMKKQQE
jgi:tetratricopeptide (TPR) repeat protein